jgi:hypothetical protein
MLWYKAWIQTRWRFLIGLALLACSAAGVVFTYPRVVELMQQLPPIDAGSMLGRRIQEAVELAREYRGYVWSSGFAKNLSQLGTLFAVLLGTGGLVSRSSGGGTLFTLSLPASRERLLGVRAAAGLAQWLALALTAALAIPLFSPAIGESFGVGSALIHGLCLFFGGAVFYSVAVLLSTVFEDVWRPLLLALLAAVLLGMPEQFVRDLSRYSIFGVMSGETYFRTGSVPWAGLLASAVFSAALLFAAARNLARRDF